MFDANKILRALQTEGPRALDALKGEGQSMANRVRTDADTRNTAIAAGAAGLLGGLLMSGGGKFGKQVATLGGLAALGTVAYQAWQKHKGATPPAQDALPPAGTAFLPAPDNQPAQEELGKAVIRAMIAATKADGSVDAEERRKLWDRLGAVNLDPDEQAFIFDELAKPLNVDEVAAGAASPEMAAEIYAASFVAIDATKPAEKAYLGALASKLNLPAGLVTEIHTAASAPA
jgi:uncharacterized membrane protein YebE (DUF533 family)